PLAVWWLMRTLVERPARPGVSFGTALGPSAAEGPRRWPLLLGLALTWVVLGAVLGVHRHPGAGLEVDVEPIDYFRTQLGVTWHYFRLLVWPFGQTPDYDWPLATRWLDANVLLPALGWVVVLALLVWLVRARQRAAAFWLGFAILALLPSSSVVPIAD